MAQSPQLNRNEVFSKNGRGESFAVVIEQKDDQVRWANHPVRTSESTGGSSSVQSFLDSHTRIDPDSEAAKSAAAGAGELVRNLPRPLGWGV